MNESENSILRMRQVVIQRLESLQRAGVFQLPRVDMQNFVSEGVEIAAPTVASPVSDKILEIAEPKSTLDVQMRKQALAAVPETKSDRKEVLDANKQLEVVRLEVAACRRCEHLACARTQTVFGIGSTKPRLCFFGEAPGADEDRLGEPFVGRAGQMLTDIIQKGMKLNRSDVYILNVLKCRPPENRKPTDEEIENCRGYFERQFEILKPEFICCLGATATQAILGQFPSLGRMRGKWFEYRGSRVMVTYHPSYLLRNPAAKKDTWEDIQMLMREMGLPAEKN